MVDWSARRPCLECTWGHFVEAGVRHVRCGMCRLEHRANKAADAQWDRRARRRADVDARRRAQGLIVVPDNQVRPRPRTPTWDQYGREVLPTPRLTPSQARSLRSALDRLDQAVIDVRAALDPPPR